MIYLPLIATEIAKKASAPTPAPPLTEEQAAAIESKYRGFKIAYCSDLPLDVGGEVRILTAGEMVLIDSRILLLRQVVQGLYARGQNTDASIVTHLIGELKGRLLFNKRMLELKPAAEWDRWSNLSESEKSLERMQNEHSDWQVKPNALNVMTNAILEESQSTDVQIFQTVVTGAILARTMEVFRAPTPPMPPGPTISRIPAFVGTRAAFRTYVLNTIRANPNHPLRFLLDASGTGFKTVSSRAHSELINSPDVWEAGHIMSDKAGGTKLMIQSAWENQVQNISVEHTRVGGAVLDNPAIEVGGLPVAKSTVLWWEKTAMVPAGTAGRAPVIQP
jgi:hypothetical protein